VIKKIENEPITLLYQALMFG